MMREAISSIGKQNPFSWPTYSVSSHDKEPLIGFIREALTARGCKMVHASAANRAPFYIVFDLPGGDRMSILAYAFLANANVIRNRPPDEHRFQIKYGSKLKGVLDVSLDPHGVTTTIFLGIDIERKLFIAADPVMNNPSPMSRSVEFKAKNIEDILAQGWSAWERERREAKTTTRRTFTLLPDIRTEILIGGKQERLLDLILLERVACGLDPGDRHLIADKFHELPGKTAVSHVSHKLLDELQIAPEALLDLISSASRLKMAVRGWVAEQHLETHLRSIHGITECTRLQGDGKPDIRLRWKGSEPIFVECKNVLRDTIYSGGIPKLDFQRTRAAKTDPCSRYYRPSDFQVVAACLHPITEQWQFSFALTSELPPHAHCRGRINNNIRVGSEHFSAHVENVLNKLR